MATSNKKYTVKKADMFRALIMITGAATITEDIAKAYGNTTDGEKIRSELIERLNHEIELCTKSRSTGEKAQAKAAEDERLTELIINVLSDDKPRTISEIQAAEPQLSINAGVNTSKVTYLCGKAVNSGALVAAKDKKKTYYGIPKAEEIEETEE